MAKRKKKRLPIVQLREAGRIATEMAIEKGLIAEKSIIDQILADSKAPKLPGLPAYLPHEWTLKGAQQIMRDLLVIWREKCEKETKTDEEYAEKVQNITEFWKFVVGELDTLEKKFAKEEKAMEKEVKEDFHGSPNVPVMKDIFAPMRKRENAKAMRDFLVDSFAVAIIVERRDTTGEYLNWFLDWTQDLYRYWVNPARRKSIKRT